LSTRQPASGIVGDQTIVALTFFEREPQILN